MLKPHTIADQMATAIRPSQANEVQRDRCMVRVDIGELPQMPDEVIRAFHKDEFDEEAERIADEVIAKAHRMVREKMGDVY